MIGRMVMTVSLPFDVQSHRRQPHAPSVGLMGEED